MSDYLLDNFITATLSGWFVVTYTTDDGERYKMMADSYDAAVEFLIPLLKKDNLL
jgi:hypothetical protein